MGLGGSIGTALFLGIGRALAAAGPLSVFLGFTISGAAVFGMVRLSFGNRNVNETECPDS
jgi:amino acid transporter